MKWRKKSSNLCDICNLVQTIEHLLFSCHRAKTLWKTVNELFGIDIAFSNIVCGFKNIDTDLGNTVTLLSFLLYKEWLIFSLEAKLRSSIFPIIFYINELELRKKVYLSCNIPVFSLDKILGRLKIINAI